MRKEYFYIFLIVCIVTHIIRTVYEILKHKNLLKPGKLSFVIMFTNMVCLWISWVLLCRYDVSNVNLPVFLKYLGLALTIIGLIIFITALLTIKTLESYEGDLITTGVYSKIRHPMYLAFILWLIGFPVYFGSMYSMILSLIFIANILFWRSLEEKELTGRFPSYSDYKKGTIF